MFMILIVDCYYMLFIVVINVLVLLVLYQSLMYGWLDRMDYKLGYKIYKKYKIEEKSRNRKLKNRKKKEKFLI